MMLALPGGRLVGTRLRAQVVVGARVSVVPGVTVPVFEVAAQRQIPVNALFGGDDGELSS